MNAWNLDAAELLSHLAPYASMALLCFEALVLSTNLIVEAVKGALWDRLPTNVTALAVAELLVLLALFAAAAIFGFAVAWYELAACVILGLLVAYAAMFGYDKLLSQLFEKWGEMLSGVSK